MTMQKEEERQNRVLKEIIDNAKELPVESQNLLLILARGMVFTRNCMMRTKAGAPPRLCAADQPRMPPDKHSA